MANKKEKKLSPRQLEETSRLFAALAEPNRLAILQSLPSGGLSVSEIAAKTSLRQANVSKQLGILYQARLLDRRKEGMRVIYFIRDTMIFDLCALVCRKIKQDALSSAAQYQN